MSAEIQARALEVLERMNEERKLNGAAVLDEPADEVELNEPRLSGLLLTRSDLRNLPDPEPMIDNVLDQGTTALLYGKWGTCKSFIALDWAACIASGKPWQGRAAEQRKVLYVAGEGAFGLKGRIDTWEYGWQTDLVDGQIAVLPRPVTLTHYGNVSELVALVEWGGYSFIVFDTLARCMVGADENAAKDCGQVVDALNRIREATPGGRGVVLGVHHAGKDGKTWRGSSAFEAGADTVYSTAMDGSTIILDREKRKDGPDQDSHMLRLSQIEGQESCVIESSHGDARTGSAVESVRRIFVSHFLNTGASRSDLRDTAVANGVSRATAYRCVSELVGTGFLVNTGSDARPFYRLGDESDD